MGPVESLRPATFAWTRGLWIQLMRLGGDEPAETILWRKAQ